MRNRIEAIYLVHHSHMDIGYTDLAAAVRELHLRHLDLALELACEPEFHWTIESAWIVEDHLRLRPARQVERLFAALRAGQFELEAFYAQPFTEMPIVEEAIDSLRFAAELGRQHGFPVQCAMLNDLGGYMGRLPTLLNGWGVRYFVAGAGSYQVHLPWADLPHLFYLQDKSGARILVWNLGIDRKRKPQTMETLDAVYGMGATYLPTFPALEKRLAAEGYPFAEVMLQHACDNGGPDTALVARLAEWRREGKLPPIRLTTPLHFFRAMEKQYAGQIPVLEGVITDPWIVRVNTMPAPLAKYREAQRILKSTATDARPVFEQLHLFADHTCGLSEWNWPQLWAANPDCRAPAFDRYRQSWADKARYAETALRLASVRSDAVRRSSSHVSKSPERLTASLRTNELHSPHLSIVLDPATGAILQLRDKRTGQQWARPGFGEFRYARIENVSQNAKAAGMVGGIKHRWVEGKLAHIATIPDGILRERVFDTPGQPLRVIEEITLDAAQPRADFRYHIKKPEIADKESCYIPFEFDLPGAVFRCDQTLGWIEPRRDLLPGAMQDAFYTAQWADLSTESRGVTLICHDAPVLQVGRIRTFEWRDRLPFTKDGSALIAWPYHNLMQTDCPIWQELDLTIRFSLFFHPEAGFDPMECDRCVTQSVRSRALQRGREDLTIDSKTALKRSTTNGEFTLESATARIASQRLLPDGRTLCVRIEERTGHHGEAVLCFERPPSAASKARDFFHDQLDPLKLEGANVRIPLRPWELATVRITK